MAFGSVGDAEFGRLTAKLGRNRYRNRTASGLRDTATHAERIAAAAAAERKLALAVGTKCGNDPRIVSMAAEQARAESAARGRVATAFTLHLTVPADTPEAQLRECLRNAYETAAYDEVSIFREPCGRMIAHVTAYGEPDMPCSDLTEGLSNTPTQGNPDGANDLTESPAQGKPDGVKDLTESPEPSAEDTPGRWHIVMAGTAGRNGTLLMYRAHAEELAARYPAHFLETVSDLAAQPEASAMICLGKRAGAAYALPCGEGGVYAALWHLGERLRTGMRIELPEIPIAQTTIEVCEMLDIDPYQIDAGGSVLFVTEDPDGLLRTLWDTDGVAGADIGILTEDAARVLENRGETRYLEPYRGGDIEE